MSVQPNHFTYVPPATPQHISYYLRASSLEFVTVSVKNTKDVYSVSTQG